MGHNQSKLTVEKMDTILILILVSLDQGSPTPGPQTGTGPQPVRKQAAQPEVSDGQASEASSALPIARITA